MSSGSLTLIIVVLVNAITLHRDYNTLFSVLFTAITNKALLLLHADDVNEAGLYPSSQIDQSVRCSMFNDYRSGTCIKYAEILPYLVWLQPMMYF